MNHLKKEGTKLEVTNRGYEPLAIAGVGTFGAVFKAHDKMGNIVAVKKVYFDPKYKNREIEIVPKLDHPNCLKYHDHYLTKEGPSKDIYFHLVTDYLPLGLDTFEIKDAATKNFYAKLFGYQIFAGLTYLHYHGVCHRDIKPSNVLINPENGILQLCDFGSAKFLVKGEESVSYIATRSYRAPELILGCRTYTEKVDVWAAGCVLAEIVLGKPIFKGRTEEGVLESIVSIVGAPDAEDLETFAHEKELTCKGPNSSILSEKFPSSTDPWLIDLLSKIFVFNVEKRYSALQCMKHPFFKNLLSKSLPNGEPLPAYLEAFRDPEKMLLLYKNGPHSPCESP